MGVSGRRWLGVATVLAVVAARASAAGLESWSMLIQDLVDDGVSRARVDRVFADARMPRFDGLEYSLEPRESAAMYRRFLRPAAVNAARACKRAHRRGFVSQAHAHGVDPNVVAAILYVETRCGVFTGHHRVLFRVARLAMANEPANVNRNVNRLLADPEGRSPDEVVRLARARAEWLHDTFYPEVRAVFTIAARLGIDPLGIRGSGAGAFGLPQFLPTSYLEYGVDGDRNGRVSLFDPDDAIASCANYLKEHGWHAGLSREDRRRVIWHYNRSDPYIDAVLGLASRLGD
jgi:membrane-bound lytic murein transglycosylase B